MTFGAGATPADVRRWHAFARVNTRRIARILQDCDDLTPLVHGGEWTIADAAAHVVCMFRGFTAAVSGLAGAVASLVPDIDGFHERLATLNATMLATVDRSDGSRLAGELLDAEHGFAEACAAAALDDECAAPFYGPDATLSVQTVTALSVGETTVHGRDIARAAARDWYIAPEVARVSVAEAFPSMAARVLDPKAAAGKHAAYVVHVRGADPYGLRLDDGELWVTRDLRGFDADCHLSVDPVIFMLVGYGRISQWPALAQGKLTAWGRKPWLALSFGNLFVNP